MQAITIGRRLLAALACAAPWAVHAAPTLYVTDTASNRVLAIDTSIDTIVGPPIEIGHRTKLAPVASRDGSLVYVQSADGTISVIDARLQRVVLTFGNPGQQASEEPVAFTLSPDGKELYSIGDGNETVVVIDARTGVPIRRIALTARGEPATVLRVGHDGKRLFAMYPGARAIVMLDIQSGRVMAQVVVPDATGGKPTSGDPPMALKGMAIDPDDRYIYVSVPGSPATAGLARLDTSANLAVVANIPLGWVGPGLDIAPDGTRAAVISSDGNCLGSVDLRSGITAGLGTGIGYRSCYNVAVGGDGRRAYIGTYDSEAGHGVMSVDLSELASPRVVARGLSYVSFDAQSMAPNTVVPEAGAWWNPEEPGRTFNLEVQRDSLAIIASVYDANGQPTWLASSGPYDTLTGTYTGSFGTYVNGPCLGCAYRVPEYVPSVGGQLKLVFTSATTGTLYFQGGSTPIRKFVW